MTKREPRYEIEETDAGFVVKLMDGKNVLSVQPPMPTRDDAEQCIEDLKKAG